MKEEEEEEDTRTHLEREGEMDSIILYGLHGKRIGN